MTLGTPTSCLHGASQPRNGPSPRLLAGLGLAATATVTLGCGIQFLSWPLLAAATTLAAFACHQLVNDAYQEPA